MANYRELSEENMNLFNEVLNQTSIPQWINFGFLANDRQKEVYTISKASDKIEMLTNGINFVIVVNEEIFDQLTDEQQRLVFHECLAGVGYDSEKDMITFDKPDFSTYTDLLEKFGHNDIIALKESIKSLYDEKKQREEEEKAARKEKRKKKNE